MGGLASGAKWGVKAASTAEDVAAGGANSIAILPSSSEAAYPVTASIRLAERSAFPDGWAGDLLFAFSRPSEFDLPFFIGPIGSVSEKAAETGLKVLSNAAKIEAKVAAKGSSKLYSEATYKAFQRQLSKDGLKSLLKTQARIQKNLAEHIEKLQVIKKAAGYSSSVEREIKTFKSQLEAIKDLLK